MSISSGVVTAYIKPTNFCNVGCTHCYLSEAVRADKSRMSLKVFEQSCHMLRDLATAQNARHVHILWHGGEPLPLIESDFFSQTQSILSDAFHSYSESIQTSLIPYRTSMAQTIHDRFSGGVGSSIDFSTRSLNDSNESYQDIWLKKVAIARTDGLTVIPGMVVTTKELGKAGQVVDWFIANKFHSFNIERYTTFGIDVDDCPTNKEHSQFLVGLFDKVMSLMKNRERAPAINTLVAGILGVLDGQPGDRWGGGCASDFVVVEPDGSTNQCPDRTSHEAPVSFVSDGAVGFMQSPKRRQILREYNFNHQNQYCDSCKYHSWCQTGCPITPNAGSNGEVECSGYKSFLTHVEQFVSEPAGRKLVEEYLSVSVNREAA